MFSQEGSPLKNSSSKIVITVVNLQKTITKHSPFKLISYIRHKSKISLFPFGILSFRFQRTRNLKSLVLNH